MFANILSKRETLPMLKILLITVKNIRQHIIRPLKLVDKKLNLGLQSHSLDVHIQTHAQFTDDFSEHVLHSLLVELVYVHIQLFLYSPDIVVVVGGSCTSWRLHLE